jgi:hypothetical protein
MQFIHLDTAEGDYGRASLELLLKQSSSPVLEAYILMSDFPSILVASLSGLYGTQFVIISSIAACLARDRCAFKKIA